MKEFNKDILKIDDVEQLVDQICDRIKSDVMGRYSRRGGVIGISGGIDSSVTMALAARALGPEKLLGVMLPEKDSSPDSEEMAKRLADKFGVKSIVENITGALDGYGCYARRDQAVKEVIPTYDASVDKMKIGVKQNNPSSNLPPLFHLTVVKADGSEEVKRLPSAQMRTIIAASNFKQRSRMSLLYFHAEALHYVVIGTPNKHEVEQGFFVKFGDGGSDLFPIGNLYKTQVYQLAEYLGVPKDIIERTPTTDTYSAEQTQEEFFYQFPFRQMDLLWYGYENIYNAAVVGNVMGMTSDDVTSTWSNFARKKATTEYLRNSAINDYKFL
jgi:NAD+ synthase